MWCYNCDSQLKDYFSEEKFIDLKLHVFPQAYAVYILWLLLVEKNARLPLQN